MVFGCFIMVKHYTYALSESATLRRGIMQHISIFKPRFLKTVIPASPYECISIPESDISSSSDILCRAILYFEYNISVPDVLLHTQFSDGVGPQVLPTLVTPLSCVFVILRPQ